MCSTSANVCVPISVVTAIHNMPFRFSHYSSYPSAFATPELLVSTEVKFPTLRYTVSYVYIMYLNTSGVLGENGLDLRCHLWLSEHLHSTANIHTLICGATRDITFFLELILSRQPVVVQWV